MRISSHFKFDDLTQLALAKHFVDRPVLHGDFGTAVQYRARLK